MTTMEAPTRSLIDLIHQLGPTFERRAAANDAADRFCAEDFAELKENGVLSAGVPVELGGAGASVTELAAMLTTLAQYSPSTALALSMHTHQVALPAWRWRNEGGVGEPLLKRVAAENIILVSSGGSDWLDSSGTLTKVEGGYLMNARKVFSSGSPIGDLLVTSAVLDDPTDGPTVLHFAVPLRNDAVRVGDNWRALGMRATGSNDVFIEDLFIPDAAIGGRRPKGTWGIFHLVMKIAIPLIYSVYLGIAERARDTALELAARKRDDAETRLNVGEMENALRAARLAHREMIRLAETAAPGPETTNEIAILRTLTGDAAIATVENAMAVAGGAGFFRSTGLERLFRDVQAARYHPLTEKKQLDLTGRVALGLPIE
jgi:alkylation response protein AidB-like acyl-CoA dehydrogenase